MAIKDWNIEELTGYKPLTTFYTDFSIADKFGVEAVKDTFNRAFEMWKDDYKFLTELVMVMSWKSFEHEEDFYKRILYTELYMKLDNYAMSNLKGDELQYYIRTTD